ncbi:MAG: M28 family peptidase [Clostridiales bacterium]|nr:M28 family peptidase [Clostridiales bacterium]
MDNEENVVEQEQAPIEQDAAQSAEGESAPEQSAPVAEESTAAEKPAAEEVAETEDKPQVDKKNKKAKKQPTVKKTAEQKSKLFRIIYYPVIAVFVLLMLIFSAVDGVSGYSPSAYGDKYYTTVNAHIKQLSVTRSSMAADGDGGVDYARDYIVSTLTAGGFTEVEESKTERDELNGDKNERQTTVTDWAKDGETRKATVTVQTSTLDSDLQDELGLTEHLVGKNISNVIAAIPSTNKAKAGAVVITVRYDSRTDTTGAASNAAFVANTMQSLIEINKSGTKFKNDIIVVFTEDLDYSYGAYAFFNLFEGLDGVVARAKAGVNLDAYGNGGTLALTDASGAGLDYINAYSKVSDNALNLSVIPSTLPDELKNRDAVKAFGDIPAVQVAVLGGLDATQSSLDTAGEISQSIVKQQARFVKDYIEQFGNSTDKYSAKSDDNTAYFSYIDGGTVVYNAVAAYVVGALILAVAVAVVITMIFKKTFSLKNMFIALGVQLLVVISTLAAMVAAYFLVTLMLTGFGVLPLQAITQLHYSNAGIIIAAILVTLAASFGFTTLYKKLFRVTSSDAVRGTAWLFGLAGAVMSFACPAYSYLTSWLGLTLMAVLLLSVCLHKKFKAKFGFGMDRLYLYVIPAALCLPLIMPTITALAGILPLVLLPVLFTMFTAVLGVGVPYLDRSQPVLDKVAKKLPKRTIRVERVVTEKVEDRAKKGKFTEKTFKRVEKEKVAINYKNYFGISVVAVLGIVIALFSGGFGVNFNKTLTNYYSYNDAIYNDSLVYELTDDEQKVVVGDLMAYKFMRYHISDLEWDGAKNRYSKTVDYNINEIIAREPSVVKDGNKYTITTFDGARSNVVITIPSASSITRITVKEYSKDDGDYEGYVYDYEKSDQIVLRLPYGFDTLFTLEIEGGSPSKIEYEEYRTVAEGDTVLDALDEWNSVKGDADMQGLRAGIVIKRTLSV